MTGGGSDDDQPSQQTRDAGVPWLGAPRLVSVLAGYCAADGPMATRNPR
jgi:hypothetical protein